MNDLEIWAEKYRPEKLADVILPEDKKDLFQSFVDNKFIPNTILVGLPGTGKTTAILAAIKEIGAEYFMINGSLDNGVDTIRYDITNFASSMSLFSEGRKYVIVDEADYLSNNAQAAFRGLIQDYAKTCSFIFTCNYINRLMKELHSRFDIVNFEIQKKEKPKVAKDFFHRTLAILDMENVEYDKAVIANLIQNTFPDFRKTLVLLQSYYIKRGKIDVGILSAWNKDTINDLFDMIKKSDIQNMRKWVSENSGRDYNTLYREIYDIGSNRVENGSMGAFIVTLGEYLKNHAIVSDPEINFMAFLVSVSLSCGIK